MVFGVSNEEKWDGKSMRHAWVNWKSICSFDLGTVKFGKITLDGEIILKWILLK
jgi:hypothetical protein